jgi:hypothetical protein
MPRQLFHRAEENTLLLSFQLCGLCHTGNFSDQRNTPRRDHEQRSPPELAAVEIVGSRSLNRSITNTPVPIDYIDLKRVANDMGQLDVKSAPPLSCSFLQCKQAIRL